MTVREFIAISNLQKKLNPKLCLYNVQEGKDKRAYYLGLKGYGIMLCEITKEEYLEFKWLGLK